MRAWTREISLSPPRLPRPGVERPTTSSCSRAIDEPAALPATTLRDSPAIGGQPNHGFGRTASPRAGHFFTYPEGVSRPFPDQGSAHAPVKVGEARRGYARDEEPPDEHPRQHGPLHAER